MQIKKELILLSAPLKDIYADKDEIGNDEKFVLINPDDPEKIIAEFHVEDIPSLDKNLLELHFLRSVRDRTKMQTVLFVQ